MRRDPKEDAYRDMGRRPRGDWINLKVGDVLIKNAPPGMTHDLLIWSSLRIAKKLATGLVCQFDAEAQDEARYQKILVKCGKEVDRNKLKRQATLQGVKIYEGAYVLSFIASRMTNLPAIKATPKKDKKKDVPAWADGEEMNAEDAGSWYD